MQACGRIQFYSTNYICCFHIKKQTLCLYLIFELSLWMQSLQFEVNTQLESSYILSTLMYPLTLSWRNSLRYRNQSIDSQRKLINWFLYDRDLRHERVNASRPFPRVILGYNPTTYAVCNMTFSSTFWSSVDFLKNSLVSLIYDRI